MTTSDTLTASAANSLPVTIGSRAASGLYLAGSLDEIAVYPTVLPVARINIHAHTGNSDSAAVTTAYYTATTAPANSCAGAGVVGLASQTLDADPDGTGPAQRAKHLAVYDPLGRLVGNQTVGDVGWSCAGYDARGRPATGTDSAGHQVVNNFNDATSPGTVTQSYTDSAGGVRSTTSTVDLLQRPTIYSDEQGGTTTFTYDQVGRPSDSYRTVFGGTQTHLTHITYDAYSRPSTQTEYLSGAARTTSIGYDAQGRPHTETLPNQVVTTTSYDPDLGYLTGLTNVTSAAVHVSDWTYHQTLGGTIDTDTNVGVHTRSYTYDQAGRLTQTVEGSVTRLYAYDANSNRCSLAATCDGTWAYNAADQLTASPQATSYSYNNDGSLTSASRTDVKTETISYDANNHATTIDDGTTTVAETLAAGGRVLERIVTSDATHAVTEDTLYGYSDSGDSPSYTRAASGAVVTSYLGACVDVGGTATWQIRNGHGDVVGMVDASGAYVANPTVDEFGAGSTPTSRLGYLGGAERFTTDSTLGLIRMGVRLYDPTLGRFLQVDPIPGGSSNAYDYVNQDPINGFDLNGLLGPAPFCSDDFCSAKEALIQMGNRTSPLEKSSDYVYQEQNNRENNKIDRMVGAPPQSMTHDVVRAIKDEAEIIVGAVGVVSVIGGGPVVTKVLLGVGAGAGLVSTGITCLNSSLGACARSAASFGASFALDFFVPVPTKVSLKIAKAAVSEVINRLGF